MPSIIFLFKHVSAIFLTQSNVTVMRVRHHETLEAQSSATWNASDFFEFAAPNSVYVHLPSQDWAPGISGGKM
jgi:hypothetical protein